LLKSIHNAGMLLLQYPIVDISNYHITAVTITT